jgi:TetR/AcrR family transcriptional regulator
MQAGERRNQLLDTALEIFSRKGFGGTTTKDVALAAGVNEAVIFRHFPTKQALYAAVLEYKHQFSGFGEWVAELREKMTQNDDEAVFRCVGSKIIAIYRADKSCQRLWMFAALEGHEQGLEFSRQLTRSVVELMTEYIERRQREGAIRDFPAKAILGMVAGSAQNYAMMTTMFGYPAEAPDERVADTFARIVLSGVRAANE